VAGCGWLTDLQVSGGDVSLPILPGGYVAKSKKNPSGQRTITRRLTAVTYTNRFTKAQNKRFTIKPPFRSSPKVPR